MCCYGDAELMCTINNYLYELCEDSTNVVITKYDMFKDLDLPGSYRDYRECLGNCITDFVEANGYDLNIRYTKNAAGKVYREYVIVTEKEYKETGTRNRVYVRKDILNVCGIQPGNICRCSFADENGKCVLYISTDACFVPTDCIKSAYCTVEKTGGLRVTLPEHIRYFNDSNIIVF
jgi:hypothetical protein